jgi:hypothetical protein
MYTLLLVMREKQIETVMRYHYISIRIAKTTQQSQLYQVL